MSTASPENRTTTILEQTLGPEFLFYHNRLEQPDSMLVIKLGGAIVDQQLDEVSESVRTLTDLGIYPFVVHGAGPQIDNELRVAGITERRALDGTRITDEQTLAVVARTLGSVNEHVSERFNSFGINTLGVKTGVFEAELKDVAKYGRVGEVATVNTVQILESYSAGIVPVVSCLGMDANGGVLNVNGDTASSALAIALDAYKFITLTDSGGVRDANGNIISVINIRSGDVKKLIDDGIITDGMIPKITEMTKSVEKLPSDSAAVITNPSSLIRELFTHAGEGTLIRKGEDIDHHPISAVSQREVRNLINTAFGGTLVSDYFTELPKQRTTIFITPQQYNGVAVVITDSRSNGHVYPAYMDKLAVRPEMQGMGLGAELVTAAATYNTAGLFWRSRKRTDLYDELANEVVQTSDGWVVYLANVKAEDKNYCIQKAVSNRVTVEY